MVWRKETLDNRRRVSYYHDNKGAAPRKLNLSGGGSFDPYSTHSHKITLYGSVDKAASTADTVAHNARKTPICGVNIADPALHTQEVTGSSPAVSTKKYLISSEIRYFLLLFRWVTLAKYSGFSGLTHNRPIRRKSIIPSQFSDPDTLGCPAAPAHRR